MPAAKRRPRNRSTRRASRQSGVFSFGSFIGGMVLGAAVVLTITYRSEETASASTIPDVAVETPLPDIIYKFPELLRDAELKTGVEPVSQPEATDPGPREYVLHAAQFLRQEDAQVLQAELMLDGMPVSLSSSPRERGGAWHRVLVGPYASESDAQEALGELRARDFPALILTRPLSGPEPPT